MFVAVRSYILSFASHQIQTLMFCRSLVKKGEMPVTMTTDSKKGGKTSKLWLFLFSDVLFIARKKRFVL